MQLKIRRSQREGGVISKNVIFCLDARVQFTDVEQANLSRYKLINQVIYNSEASQRALSRSDALRDGSMSGSLKSLAFTAMAAMRLNITVSSLTRGQHIECKSLDELLGAESAIEEACQNLKGYLDVAATFDGREVLIDYSSVEGTVIAQTATPQPMLAAPPTPSSAAPAPPVPALEYAVQDSSELPAPPAHAPSGPPQRNPIQELLYNFSLLETKYQVGIFVVLGIALLMFLNRR